MIKPLLSLICVVAGLPVSGMFAQSPPPAHPTPTREMATTPDQNPLLDGNYVLTLSSADKKGPEISVLVASQRFSVANSEQSISFSGQLASQEKGGYVLTYDLLQGNILIPVMGQTSTHATVLLRLGEAIQIVKNGAQFYNLKLDRYNPAGPAKGNGVGAAESTPAGTR